MQWSIKLLLFIYAAVSCCPVDVLLLVDTTVGSPARSPGFTSDILTAFDRLAEEFPQLRLALAAFTDKPAPFVGLGTYGGYPAGYATDWCYKVTSPFSGGYKVSRGYIERALDDLPVGSGLDEWEGIFDALVRAALDGELQWSSRADKVIVIVTDTFGHTGDYDTLQDHVDAFNGPIVCKNGYSSGGFGAMDPTDHWIGWALPTDAYAEYAELMYAHMCVDRDMSVTEQERMKELHNFLQPSSFPPVRAFDKVKLIEDAIEHCAHHEYPSYKDIVDITRESDTKVLVLQIDEPISLNRATVEEVWGWALGAEEGLKNMTSFYAHVNQGNSVELSEALVKGMKELINDKTCDCGSVICPCEVENCDCCDALVDINFTFRGSISNLNVHVRT